jgi:hypothetical protein
MALQHDGLEAVQLSMQRSDNGRMVVAKVLYAVPGKKIQDAITVFGKQFSAFATGVANVHLEQIQEPDPLGIHVVGVSSLAVALMTIRDRRAGRVRIRRSHQQQLCVGTNPTILLKL